MPNSEYVDGSIIVEAPVKFTTRLFVIGDDGLTAPERRIAALEDALVELYKWSGGTADTADGGWLNEAFNRHANLVCQMPRFQRAEK